MQERHERALRKSVTVHFMDDLDQAAKQCPFVEWDNEENIALRDLYHGCMLSQTDDTSLFNTLTSFLDFGVQLRRYRPSYLTRGLASYWSNAPSTQHFGLPSRRA
jgi:hypothetical protein